MTDENNVDSLLSGQKNPTQPAAPEHSEPVPDTDDGLAFEVTDNQKNPPTPQKAKNDQKAETEKDDVYGLNEEEGRGEEVEAVESDTDEYGNERPSSRTYTEDEVNQRINEAVRDRLARLERNQSQQYPNQAQVQQQAQENFQYDANSSETWQQQLEQFVEQTVTRMGKKHAETQRAEQERRAQVEFEQKFQDGMSRFKDYVAVVGDKPISDAMVIATRSMKDPAAFIYAASKRAPQELERIARLPDQYAQMVEMGKLEERMRKTKPSTNSPRPLSKTKADSNIPHKGEKAPTIEDLIKQSDAKRLAALRARNGR